MSRKFWDSPSSCDSKPRKTCPVSFCIAATTKTNLNKEIWFLVFGFRSPADTTKETIDQISWQLLSEKALTFIINVHLKFSKTKGICSIVLMTKNTLIVSGASLQTRNKSENDYVVTFRWDYEFSITFLFYKL